MYHDMAVTVRDEGGVILPMFNQFIDATSAKVGGWVKDDPHQEMMNGGYALAKCWLNA
jgi:peptide/nickel transport system substrate-binding protein